MNFYSFKLIEKPWIKSQYISVKFLSFNINLQVSQFQVTYFNKNEQKNSLKGTFSYY